MTGGVTTAAVATLDRLRAAQAIGLGGELLPKALRDAGAWSEISRNAAELLAELRPREA